MARRLLALQWGGFRVHLWTCRGPSRPKSQPARGLGETVLGRGRALPSALFDLPSQFSLCRLSFESIGRAVLDRDVVVGCRSRGILYWRRDVTPVSRYTGASLWGPRSVPEIEAITPRVECRKTASPGLAHLAAALDDWGVRSDARRDSCLGSFNSFAPPPSFPCTALRPFPIVIYFCFYLDASPCRPTPEARL